MEFRPGYQFFKNAVMQELEFDPLQIRFILSTLFIFVQKLFEYLIMPLIFFIPEYPTEFRFKLT